VISLTHVQKRFGDRLAVDDLSLHVPPGEIYGLLGHNGAGKSTAIGMMLGQVWPTAGDVKVCGHEVSIHRRKALEKVGAIFESPAFYDYLSHLTPDGVLAFTRWGFDPPRESLRLLSLAKNALNRLGESDHSKHVMVVRENESQISGWGARDTVLISRKPFTATDIGRARAALRESRMQAVYLPEENIPNPFTQLMHAADPEAFYRGYQYDISPVSDDRPFFFYSVQPRDLWNFITTTQNASADYKINRAVPLLFGLMGVSIAATALILLLPPLVLGSRLPREKGILRFLWYFVFIGTGYILIQVALIQKFVLLLGHPTYALTVIIFSMLVSSGMGSFMSRKILKGSDRSLIKALLAVFVLVTLLAFVAPIVSEAGIAWPLWAKFIVTGLLIAPVGFAMGMPFPTGLTRLEQRHKPSVRWAWALNAASSVLGSASAIFLAIYLGLRETLLIGGCMYLLALIVIRFTRQTES